MVTELEKQFFYTFDTKPIRYNSSLEDWEFPPITDRILLELICIYNTYLEINLYSLEYESLKEEILKDLINEQESRELKKDYVSDDMKHQVQALFKENSNGN